MAQVAGHTYARKNWGAWLWKLINAHKRGNTQTTNEQMTNLGLARRHKI